MLPRFIRVARWRDPYLDIHSHGGLLGPAAKTAWVNIAVFLVNISIYLDKFMRAGYQQTAEMLYLSNIWTQEGIKERIE